MENIKDFLDKKTDKKKIIVIYWPTGAGKTSMSIDIAKFLDTEIISTDSRQIFKELNIGTWKITKQEKQWVKHHMLDIINADNSFSVWEFKNESEKIISKLYENWKIPILCWGTWLYIDSLIYDFDIPKIPADQKIRDKLEQEAKDFWNDYVYNKLKILDPEYAKELHPNNIRYIIRALEVKMITNKSKTDYRTEKKLKYDVLFLTPYKWDREELYSRINKRVGVMFEEWLVEEVRELLQKYKKDDFWMRSIWYTEVSNYLLQQWETNNPKEKLSLWEKVKRGVNLDLSETIELVKQHNRNYAKTQLTWFRKYK